MSAPAHLGVDVGGTFTDVALLVGETLTTAKVPTTADQSIGVISGIEKACEKASIEPDEIDSFAHGMTVSVNALLEGTGARTAIITTEGFRDVLEIGRQDRPSLYDLGATKPEPLVPRRRRYELTERASPVSIEIPIEEAQIQALAEEISNSDIESVAVCLLHSYAHPENEQRVVDVLRKECDAHVSASHEVLAEFREYERTATTVADAYVTPAIDTYISHLGARSAERGVPIPRIMQSNAGIADPETVRERAVTTVLSGPAAGVVGANVTASDRAADRRGLITFDMGGTSSDVSLIQDDEIERTTDASIGGRPIGVPMVDLTTVGAGGGSITWVDAGGALRVGPESAGADPGPACYGRGGTEPTVTDANVVLGFIGADAALGGELTLDTEAAHEVLANLADRAELDDATAAARGVYRVANATMTRAIRSVTVERGHDPRDFALVAFGGAGPMHAATLADTLGITTIVIPRACGVLSAYGLLAADERHDVVRTYRTSLAACDPEGLEDLYGALTEEVRAEASNPTETHIERAVDCRYVGQSFELTVPVTLPLDPTALEERFEEAHETAYGYRMDDPVELVNLRATATTERDRTTTAYVGRGDPERGSRTVVFGDERIETPVYERERLVRDRSVTGPAVLEGAESTIVVPPAWNGSVADDGTLVCEREDGS
jgi:N-methylhydantoinase A